MRKGEHICVFRSTQIEIFTLLSLRTGLYIPVVGRQTKQTIKRTYMHMNKFERRVLNSKKTEKVSLNLKDQLATPENVRAQCGV